MNDLLNIMVYMICMPDGKMTWSIIFNVNCMINYIFVFCRNGYHRIGWWFGNVIWQEIMVDWGKEGFQEYIMEGLRSQGNALWKEIVHGNKKKHSNTGMLELMEWFMNRFVNWNLKWKVIGNGNIGVYKYI